MSQNESVTKRSLFIAAGLGVFITCCVFCFHYFYKSRNILVFCDVGQGDAAYMRMNNSVDIVIDAGPDRSVTECVGKHMPFYDHTIEIGFISHPQKDHMYGFLFLAQRYRIEKIYTSEKDINTPSFQKLKKILQEKKIILEEATYGDTIDFPNTHISIFWPTHEFRESHQIVPVRDLNEYSLIMTVENGNMKALFTGDAPPSILKRLSKQTELQSFILKVPHHGSKNGLTRDFLRLANPTYGVISVGKNNTYGHPSSYVLDLLKAQNVQVRRTDLEGSIIFEWNKRL